MAVPLTVVDLGRIFWLRTDKANLKGFCPVSLRLTLRGHKPAEVSTGVRCRPADWAGATGKDSPLKKSHLEYLSDTDTLETLYTNAKKAARRLEALEQSVSPQAVAALLKNPKALQPGPALCLLAFMEEELETHYKPGNRGTYESQRAIVRKLRAWHGEGRLPLVDFPPKRVQAFYRSLLAAKARGGEVSNANKVVSHLAAMFRRGVKQSLWGESQNPFACLDKQSAPKKKKPRLTADEQLRVFALDLPPAEWLWRARAAWAMQFYLRGERIGACLLLQWSDLRESRQVVEYQAQKGGPHKRVRVRPELRDWLCAIERHYPGHAYVLPYLPANYEKLSAEGQLTEIKKATAVINKHLKTLMALAGIDKAISTHAARRTFASIARKVAGIAATQAFLGHTTEGMTQQYLDNSDTEELDDTADDIFNSLL